MFSVPVLPLKHLFSPFCTCLRQYQSSKGPFSKRLLVICPLKGLIYLHWMRVTRLVELLSGSTATALNVLLVPIILTKSSQRIGRYKWFLLAYTLNACLLSGSQFLALPVRLFSLLDMAVFRRGTFPRMATFSFRQSIPFPDGYNKFSFSALSAATPATLSF